MFTILSRQKRCELCRKWMPKSTCSFGNSLCDCCSPIRNKSTKLIKNEIAKVAYSKYMTIEGVNVRDREAIAEHIYRLRHDQNSDITQIEANTIFIKTQNFTVEFEH